MSNNKNTGTNQASSVSHTAMGATVQPKNIGYFKTIDGPNQGIPGSAQCVTSAYKKMAISPVKKHKPYWLTWNGASYDTSFVPDYIRMCVYDEKDYLELYNHLEQERINNELLKSDYKDFQKDIDLQVEQKMLAIKALHVMEEIRDYWYEMYMAKHHIISASEYLRTTGRAREYESFRILTEAMLSYEYDQEAYKDITEKYAKVPSKPHTEERSL